MTAAYLCHRIPRITRPGSSIPLFQVLQSRRASFGRPGQGKRPAVICARVRHVVSLVPVKTPSRPLHRKKIV